MKLSKIAILYRVNLIKLLLITLNKTTHSWNLQGCKQYFKMKLKFVGSSDKLYFYTFLRDEKC